MLKKIWLNKSTLYIGPNSGRPVLSSIIGAEKSVLICSPYLSASYIKTLRQKQREGVEVRLITSDNSWKNNQATFNELFRKKEYVCEQTVDMKKGKLGRGLAYVCMSALLYPFFTSGWIWLPAVWGFIRLTDWLSTDVTKTKLIPRLNFVTIYDAKPPFRKEDSTLHAKFMVIDGKEVFLGSHNFSEKGFYYNYETSIKSTDEYAIRRMTEEFDWLYGKYSKKKPKEQHVKGKRS